MLGNSRRKVMMTWKRRRSRSVAEARMRIGKTQFSSLHQPVCRLACITSVVIMVVVVGGVNVHTGPTTM